MSSLINNSSSNDSLNDSLNDSSNKKSIDSKIEQFIHMNKNIKNIIIKPTPFNVSTHSAKAKLTLPIDISILSQIFYKNLTTFNNDSINIPYFSISYNDLYINLLKNKKNKKNKKKSNFFNCCSVIVKSIDNSHVNIKLFKNSSVTMTGCKTPDSGLVAIRLLVNEIKKYKEVSEEDISKLDVDDYQITMINANYSVGYKLDANELFSIIKNEYNLYVSYEPDRYQGVKISYLWNILNKRKDGKCHCDCEKKCTGKGKNKNGLGKNNCKKVTVAIFKTGSVVITGAKMLDQTIDAYDFINSLIKKHSANIIRFSLLDIMK